MWRGGEPSPSTRAPLFPRGAATFAGAFRFQLHELISDTKQLTPLVTVPLFGIVFLAIVTGAGRKDLAAYAVFAPALIGMWSMCLFISGEMIESDRVLGILQAIVAAPARFEVIVLGRVAAVTVASLAGFAEAWIVAYAGFGVRIRVAEPLVFVLSLLLTTVAMTAVGALMAALFVLARNARAFQNSLSYPFYILGGVLVPTSFLPSWLRPVTWFVFLSWSSGLLRQSTAAPTVTSSMLRLLPLAALAAAMVVVACWTVHLVLRKAREEGSLEWL